MAQTKASADLVQADRHRVQLFFYPSTLRMLNVEKDPVWNELVKDVRHLRLLIYDSDSFLMAQRQAVLQSLRADQFEELVSMRSDSLKLDMYGRYKGEKMVGMVALVMMGSRSLVVDLDGAVDPMQAYKLTQNGIDLPVLSSYFDKKEEEEERRRKYREFRQSLEEDEKAKKDSLTTQDSIKK